MQKTLKTENGDFLKIGVFLRKNHDFQGSSVQKNSKRLIEKNIKNSVRCRIVFSSIFHPKIVGKSTKNDEKKRSKKTLKRESVGPPVRQNPEPSLPRTPSPIKSSAPECNVQRVRALPVIRRTSHPAKPRAFPSSNSIPN